MSKTLYIIYFEKFIYNKNGINYKRYTTTHNCKTRSKSKTNASRDIP